MEIRCQIIFIKHRFWKIHELETFGTRKRILGTKLERCSCDRKRRVVFWTFHTFPCIFFPRAIFRAVHGWFANRQMYGQFKTRLDAFWHSYIPPILFLKSFSYCQKVSIHEFFQKRCFLKIIWHRISIQTLLFRACLPTRQYRDKAYYSNIEDFQMLYQGCCWH